MTKKGDWFESIFVGTALVLTATYSLTIFISELSNLISKDILVGYQHELSWGLVSEFIVKILTQLESAGRDSFVISGSVIASAFIAALIRFFRCERGFQAYTNVGT